MSAKRSGTNSTTGAGKRSRKKASPSSTSSPLPNPGSPAAIDLGCTCPVLDNERGRGYMGMKNVYVYHGGCPLHKIKET